jgi:hypothetical protein
MSSKRIILSLICLASFWATAFAHAAERPVAAIDCSKTVSIHCGKTPSVAADGNQIWAVFVQQEHVYLTRSTDTGATWSRPAKVNAEPEQIETNGENRPKLAVTDKALLLSWTQKTAGRFTGDVRFTRSTNGGDSFAEPRTLNDDGLLTSHRFDSLQVTPDGRVLLAWLDKRDKVAAEARNENYSGSALYLAVSRDHGASFSANRRVAHHSCECCRVALAPASEGGWTILWRHLFEGGMRDHAFAQVSPNGEVLSLERATVDQWKIDACPHHGPALAPSSRPGRYHLAWFSDGTRHQGIYYGHRHSQAGVTRQVTAMDTSPSASHPQVLEHQGHVYFVWKWFDGDVMQILLRESNDHGESWSEARSLATTAGASDHPALVVMDDAPFLAWHTQAEGFRLLPVDVSVPRTGNKETAL